MDCFICYEKVYKSCNYIFPCEHNCCKKCLFLILKNSDKINDDNINIKCPFCRKDYIILMNIEFYNGDKNSKKKAKKKKARRMRKLEQRKLLNNIDVLLNDGFQCECDLCNSNNGNMYFHLYEGF